MNTLDDGVPSIAHLLDDKAEYNLHWPPPDLTVPWKILPQIASNGIDFWLLFLINICETPVTVSCGFGLGRKVYTHILLPLAPL
jgi:hypothetical protein